MAFVGITNHVLDAAKTNRAVSLFRPTASHVNIYYQLILCMTYNNVTYAGRFEDTCKRLSM